MVVTCLDLEGVLVPEIWIAFAEKTGIEKLRLTTRDIPDYDELMRGRLKILDENNLKLADIQEVIGGIAPLPGAKEFLSWLESEFQVIILSDTFNQFAGTLMAQLDYPTLFCHDLFLDSGTDEVSLQVAEDEDYEIFFKVNVSFANLRNKPNTKTSTILFVLTQGTQVEILEKKGKWSKIRSKPGPKELARTGWLASNLIDSEIK